MQRQRIRQPSVGLRPPATMGLRPPAIMEIRPRAQMIGIHPQSIGINPRSNVGMHPLSIDVNSHSAIGGQSINISPRSPINRSSQSAVLPFIPPIRVSGANLGSINTEYGESSQLAPGRVFQRRGSAPTIVIMDRPTSVIATSNVTDDDNLLDVDDIATETNELSQPFGSSQIGQLSKDKIVNEQFDRDLIDLVREHEYLWDFYREDHRDKQKCDGAWNQIAEDLNRPGFDGFACQNRFSILRSSFKRELDKIPASGDAYEEARGKVKWKFFTALEFLKDTFKPRKSRASWSNDNQISPAGNTDTSTGDEIDRTAPKKKKTQKRPATDPLLPPDVSASFSEACASMKRMGDVLAIDDGKSAPPIQDPNVALGKMIAAELSTISAASQPKARSAIRKAVNEILDEFQF